MSKINAIRIVNLNYNNNSMQINDEIFHTNGRDTLFSLRNAGGKSVIVQMVSSLFVNKRYRDAKDRPFDSYFTGSDPTYIMVEWMLDEGAGYILTGSMIRKNSRHNEENESNLEMIYFISEYREPCIADINNIDIVTKTKKGMILKNFTSVKQLFETHRKNRKLKFYFYDMTNSTQTRSYFEKLGEYRIYNKEWEQIHKKVNMHESGLSSLFKDCKNTKSLVEKWFFPAIENKINKENDRMKKFREIALKYALNYDRNLSKFEYKEKIKLFEEKMNELLEKANAYKEADIIRKDKLNRIDVYYAAFKSILEDKKIELSNCKKEIEYLEKSLSYIDYEELSYEAHKIDSDIKEKESILALLNIEIDSLENEIKNIKNDSIKLDAAKCRDVYIEEKKELNEIGEKIRISGENEEKLRPELENAGACLKKYYESALDKGNIEYSKIIENINEDSEKSGKQSRILDTLREEKEECIKNIGETLGSIREFNREEDRFNKKYKENFSRNLFDKYDDEFIFSKEKDYEKDLRKYERAYLESIKRSEEIEKRIREAKDQEENKKDEELILKQRKELTEKKLETFKKEIEEREKYAAFLEFKGDLYNKTQLLDAFDRKIDFLNAVKRDREKKLDVIEREIRKLKTGEIIDIPDEIKAFFEKEGIVTFNGFEWLKQYDADKKKKEKLIKENPFIPYSIVASEKAIAKLKDSDINIYTSELIPIVPKEKLVITDSEVNKLEDFGKVNFYCLFNNEFLYEEKLNRYIDARNNKRDDLLNEIAKKREECEKFCIWKNKVKNHEVTKEERNVKLKELEEISENIEGLLLDLKTIRNQKEALKENKKENEENYHENIRKKDKSSDRLNDFIEFKSSYDLYLENMDEKQRLERKAQIIEEKTEASEKIISELSEKLKRNDIRKENLKRHISELNMGKMAVQKYKSVDRDISEEEFLIYKAKYNAITEKYSGEIKELKLRKEKQIKKVSTAKEDYNHILKDNNISELDISNIIFSREEKVENKKQLINRKDQLASKICEQKNVNDYYCVIKDRRKRIYEDINKKFNKTDIIPIELIKDDNFDEKRADFKYHIKEDKIKQETLSSDISLYKGYSVAFDEHKKNIYDYDEEIKAQIYLMSPETLDEEQNLIKKEYRESKEKVLNMQKKMRTEVSVLNMMKEFREENFQSPLKIINKSVDSPDDFILQIQTTIKSFNLLMKKLEIDLKFMENEKSEICNQLEDYLYDVQKEFESIDENLSIIIKNRSEKMFVLESDDWNENEEIYKIRISDFVDRINKGALKVIKNNENLAEYFSVNFVLRLLYDFVIGTSNINIQIRKVEAERSYLISWRDAGTNSGAESFLSSFIVLSALMNYMRKNDKELFFNRNESKVLIMDNPFAQTSSKHILEPLMKMAKKTDTQIIALSDIGNEAVYNSFENIYVLNIIPAKLRNTQYIKSDHIKGEDGIKEMIPSHIELYEQMTLF